MTRYMLIAAAVAVVGLCPAADAPKAPAPTPAAPVELVFLGEEEFVRVELRVEVDGKAVSTIWGETFARIFSFGDRDGNGVLDATEAAHLPSALALRQAMGNGFTPPVGRAPAFADLDRDGDGKVTPDELATFYRSAGVGNVLIGIGRLPASADLTEALLKRLDANGDGKVTENEWKAAADTLKKLDKNDDELIGAGELVPKTVYPGAAGTTLLTPPKSGQETPDAVTKFPMLMLPEDPKDTQWATETVRRNPKFKLGDLEALRKRAPGARWVIRLGKSQVRDRLALSASRFRIDAWATDGKLVEASASARKLLTASFVKPASEPKDGEDGNRRPGGGDLAWLTPIADRNGDGTLDRNEFDAWINLQEQIARGQVLLTVLDSGGLFELLDTNHDGALSVRELRNAWGCLHESGCVTDGAFDPKKLPRVMLAATSRGYPLTIAINMRRGPAWFQAMDKNGDGDVSRLEFTGPADVFDKLDVDKDGLITPAEAEKAGK